jgi:peptidoglycan/LPS O-acetylase OafA/YrhL
MLLAPALFVTAGLSTADARTNLNLNPDLIALRFNPMVRLPEFIIGVLVGRLAMRSQWRLPFWIVPLSAVAIFVVLYWSYDLPRRLSETFVENGVYTPLFVLLIVAIARSSRPILVEPIWVRLGAASYALYIIHMPIWGMFRFAGRVGAIGNVESNVPLYGCYLAIVLGGALLVHRYIEQPCRYAIRRRLENATPFARQARNADAWAFEHVSVERPDFATLARRSEQP